MKYSLVWGGAWTVGGISGILAIQAGSSSELGGEAELTLACCGRLFILWVMC